jgi:predicted DNA-binding WGR domain protein
MSIAVVTYPRTGSTYLAWLFGYSFGTQIDKFHLDQDGQLESLPKYDCTITTLREPAESIASIVTMESIYFRNDQDFDSYTHKTIQSRINEYIRFYTLAQNNITLHFDYNEINTKREELVKYVSKFTNTKIVNNGYVDLVKDQPSKGFLRTSKGAEDYGKVLSMVLDYDLSQCLEIHNSCKRNVVHL